MSDKNRKLRAIIVLAIAVCAFAVGSPDLPNFAGTYALVSKNKKAPGRRTTLQVTQTPDEIRSVRAEEDRTSTSFFPLNGGEGEYVTPGGVACKGKATLKGRDLILDSTALVAPQRGAPATRLHTKQRWQLSPDGKTLTIHFDVDFPDIQILNGMMNQSWTEKYIRAESAG